jgi:hypothetical protein
MLHCFLAYLNNLIFETRNVENGSTLRHSGREMFIPQIYPGWWTAAD